MIAGRNFSAAKTGIWSVLCSGGLLTLLIACGSSAEFAPLSRAEMSASRGRIQALNLTTAYCNTLSNFNNCTQSGGACNNCGADAGGETYQVVGMGSGAYDAGAANGGKCSNIYNGTCALNMITNEYYCDTAALGGGDTNNKCTKPPGQPVQED